MTPLTKMLFAASFVAGIPVQGATEMNYWLWDSNQQASYQACADAFEKENPDIKIKITQTGWFDYWTALNTAFVDEAKASGGTFFLPISEHSSDVVRILRANFDSIFLNGEDPGPKLEASNHEINALFK